MLTLSFSRELIRSIRSSLHFIFYTIFMIFFLKRIFFDFSAIINTFEIFWHISTNEFLSGSTFYSGLVYIPSSSSLRFISEFNLLEILSTNAFSLEIYSSFLILGKGVTTLVLFKLVFSLIRPLTLSSCIIWCLPFDSMINACDFFLGAGRY